MYTLRFEHPIKDFGMWKEAFDRDPIDRAGLGVCRHRIYRLLDRPDFVLGELEFETLAAAEACASALRALWTARTEAPALAGAAQVRILETVEEQTYAGFG